MIAGWLFAAAFVLWGVGLVFGLTGRTRVGAWLWSIGAACAFMALGATIAWVASR